MMFTEGTSIPAIVRESRKPFTSPLREHVLEKGGKDVDEEEYVR